MNSLIDKLQEIQNSENNFSIDCFWDNVWTIKIGDNLNGFTYENSSATSFKEACELLIKAVYKRK